MGSNSLVSGEVALVQKHRRGANVRLNQEAKKSSVVPLPSHRISPLAKDRGLGQKSQYVLVQTRRASGAVWRRFLVSSWWGFSG